MILNLAVFFSFHTILGSIFVSMPKNAFVKKKDRNLLKFSLLNIYESEEEKSLKNKKPQQVASFNG